jgi:putative membrane protein
MAEENEGGMLKQAVNKVTDVVGGLVGQASAMTAHRADSFVENAAIGDLYEITAGEIALRRGSSASVREAGKQMILDHTTSAHQLQAALEMNETRGVQQAPTGLDARRRTLVQHLGEAPDDSFDQTWLDQQVLAHEETVTLMQGYAAHGDNPQLRSFAKATAPVVERHLAHMKHLRATA